MLEKVLRTLDYKFLIKNISFVGMNRVETLEYPVPALRETLLNLSFTEIIWVRRGYFGNFKLSDESYYWETDDENRMREQFKLYDNLLDNTVLSISDISELQQEFQ
ncbi:hypothetical protein AGMMS50239_33110 [Bacteroidia bacterium]|nr:hypothetical protein AGMMS50239_33110 [Bacteroidia bacterium]GHV29761.1 hypothetical protein FACS1894177_01190 [Bacteroidia bacterium]